MAKCSICEKAILIEDPTKYGRLMLSPLRSRLKVDLRRCMYVLHAFAQVL